MGGRAVAGSAAAGRDVVTDVLAVAGAGWSLAWQGVLLLALAFGAAPTLVLRIAVKLYPVDDPHREELLAEVRHIGRVARIAWVTEQLIAGLFDGLPLRIRAWRRKHTKSQDTFPNTAIAYRLADGDTVKTGLHQPVVLGLEDVMMMRLPRGVSASYVTNWARLSGRSDAPPYWIGHDEHGNEVRF